MFFHKLYIQQTSYIQLVIVVMENENIKTVSQEAGNSSPSALQSRMDLINYVIFLYDVGGEFDGTRMFPGED